MIKIRRSQERGFEDKGWLNTYHTFSFDAFYDPDYLNFRSLRVLNEDIIKGRKGLGMQTYNDVELITYIIDGVLEHQDNLGNTCVVKPGEVQLVSAGAGIIQSEYNLSHHVPVHLIQLWIQPEKFGLEPSYALKMFSQASKWGKWCLMASRNGREGSARIRQDCDLYAALLDENDELAFETLGERYCWVQVVSGKFLVQESLLEPGDGAALQDESTIDVRCLSSGELLLLDMA